MANHSTLAQRDRDLDDGVLDLPARLRKGLKELDAERIPMKTTRKKTTTERSAGCYGDYPGVDRVPKKTSAKKRAKKSASHRMAKTKTTTPSYSNETPKGLWPVGTTVTYQGGSKLKNRWLKKGMVGRVFAYRPGRKGGGLYGIRFEGGATLLATKRVSKRGGTR